jgi:hypothetical protein
MRRFGQNPSSAQGIEAEIPQELRSNSGELERKARFLRAGTQKCALSGLKKVNAGALKNCPYLVLDCLSG